MTEGLDRLIETLDEIWYAFVDLEGGSDDLPSDYSISGAIRAFFERPDIQERMLDMNRSQLFDLQENVYGYHLGVYADKTAKHKRNHNLPDKYYTYYETGKTHESLRVYVEDNSASIWPDHETAPEYAHNLDGSAWGLNNENQQEFVPAIHDIVLNNLRTILTNG